MEVISFSPVRFDPEKRTPGANWEGGCEGLEPVCTLWREQTPFPYMESNPSPLVVYLVALSLYEQVSVGKYCSLG